MKSLCVKRCVYGDDFMNLVIPKFANLQLLNISYTSVGDGTLHLIGKYCKNLRYTWHLLLFSAYLLFLSLCRELILEGCSHITDAGMQGLCVSVDQLGKEVEGIGQCKLLEHLVTDGTNITRTGVKLGILNLPNLKRWKMVSVQFLNEVYQENFLNNELHEIPKYSLIHLEIQATKYISGSLALAVSMCPSATQVNIKTVSSLTDTDLQALQSLKSLHELEIDGYDYENVCEITFSGGVTPLLKTFGSTTLKVLRLSALRHVNVDVIIQLCSNLYSLNLDHNYNYSTARPEEEQINVGTSVMVQLEKLDLSLKKHHSLRIPPENILSLFSIPSLKKITCWNCTTLSDEILLRAARLHHFKNLESIELAVCYSVTKNGIEVLMDDRNGIKEIELNHCAKITYDDAIHWRQRASSSNWDLDIHYEEYSSEHESEEMDWNENEFGEIELDDLMHTDSDSDIEDYDGRMHREWQWMIGG